MFFEINKQKSKYESRIILAYVLMGFSFISYIPLAVFLGPVILLILGSIFIWCAFYSAFLRGKIKELSISFKEVYVKEELEKVLPDSHYDPVQGFSEEEVLESKLRKKADRFESEDMIWGTYEDVKFKSCDVVQKKLRSNGKSTTLVTVFQGRIYEFDFSKPFYYNLLVLQPNQYLPFEGYERIQLESIAFNSNLKVYAKNNHEAFYLLTPLFMEKLLLLDSVYYDKISFSFLDKKLYIAIDSRLDYFDVQPFKKVSQELVDSYKNEFEKMISFIKDLKLNDKLFRET